jgi:hypothetical protein
MMNAAAAPSPDEAEETAPVPDPDAQQEGSEPAAPSGDTGPLESIDVQPAEHGAFVVKHHPKASARVKHMDHESMRTNLWRKRTDRSRFNPR